MFVLRYPSSHLMPKKPSIFDFFQHVLVLVVLELHVNGTILYLYFCVGFFPLGVKQKFEVYQLCCISSELLIFAFDTEWYPSLWINHRLFIHSSVLGHLDYFQFGAIINKSPKDIHLQVFSFTYIFIFLGYKYKLYMWNESQVRGLLNFYDKIFILISKVFVSFCMFTSNV